MTCEPFTPERWRNRAAEARARAEEIRDENARRVTLEMAAAYDRLAEITAAEELGYQGGLRVDL
jgi:hypothetical protein